MSKEPIATFHAHMPDQMIDIALQLLRIAGDARRKWTFEGMLGTGKTTLIQALCHHIGVREAVTSPTFAIVNEYIRTNAQRQHEPVYHLDLYRIQSLEEALAIDIEDLLLRPYYTFIEWPELITPLLPADVIQVRIEHTSDSGRKVLLL